MEGKKSTTSCATRVFSFPHLVSFHGFIGLIALGVEMGAGAGQAAARWPSQPHRKHRLDSGVEFEDFDLQFGFSFSAMSLGITNDGSGHFLL